MKNCIKVLLPTMVIVLLLLAACGAPTGTAGAGGGQQVTGETGESDLDIVVFTFAAGGSIDDGIHDNFSVLNELTRQTGVVFDFVRMDDERFRVLAAAMDLPDLFHMQDASMIEPLREGGMLLGLNDLIDRYAPNVASTFEMTMRHQALIFGDTYLFPYEIFDEPAERRLPLRNEGSIKARYDIWTAIGQPVITDPWDGFFDVLEQMQEYARERYYDNSIFAFSSWNDWGIWPYICAYPFSHGHGDIFEVNQLVHIETNTIQDAFLDTDGIFWEGIKWLWAANSRGLFDPEGLVQNWGQYEEKVRNGRVLVSFASWLQPHDDLVEQGAVLTILPGSVGQVLDLTPRIFPLGNRFSNALAVNSSINNPERFIQMMNWTTSTEGKRTLENGIQGVTWDYVDGIPQFIGVFRDEYLYTVNWEQYHNTFPSGIRGDSYAMLSRAFSGNAERGFAPDGFPYFLMNRADMIAIGANPAERAFAENYGHTYPGEVYMMWVEQGLIDAHPLQQTMAMQLFGTVDEDIATAVASARRHFEASLANFIFASSEEDFYNAQATFIDELLAMGYGEISAAIARQFEDAKALVDEFMGN